MIGHVDYKITDKNSVLIRIFEEYLGNGSKYFTTLEHNKKGKSNLLKK